MNRANRKYIKIKVDNGFYSGLSGDLLKSIPGGNFFMVKLENDKTTALHITEFSVEKKNVRKRN